MQTVSKLFYIRSLNILDVQGGNVAKKQEN